MLFGMTSAFSCGGISPQKSKYQQQAASLKLLWKVTGPEVPTGLHLHSFFTLRTNTAHFFSRMAFQNIVLEALRQKHFLVTECSKAWRCGLEGKGSQNPTWQERTTRRPQASAPGLWDIHVINSYVIIGLLTYEETNVVWKKRIAILHS